MQTYYLWRWVKGFRRFEQLGYRLSMITKEAQERLRILPFWDKYGLEAAIEAFAVSKRTLYRWKAALALNANDILSLNPKSRKPHSGRSPATPKSVIDEIKRLREKYPNIGKEKIFILLKPFRLERGLPPPSSSTIGRIIAKRQRQDENVSLSH
jgi:hypothetical protein